MTNFGKTTASPTKGRALVVGLGVAGLSAALGLRNAGWETLLIERAPSRRLTGYFVGVFPAGKEAMSRLGADEHIHIRNPENGTTWEFAADGSCGPGAGFLDRPGAPWAVMRPDIEAGLWDALHAEGSAPVEIRYATSPVAIVDGANRATVTLKDAAADREYTEDFDLVVGADGLRSTVRRLTFGSHEKFIQQWNAIIVATALTEQVPGYAPSDSITDAQPRRAAWVFGFKDRAPGMLLTYRTKDVEAQFTRPHLETLREVYAGSTNPAVLHALNHIENSDDYLFDSVNQVHMKRWHKGRVVLVGDSAWCLNLYSGMGATAAMRGGADLGDALAAHPGDVAEALSSWERGLRPFITTNSLMARVYSQLFVPSSPLMATVRSSALKVMGAFAIRARKKTAATETKEPAAVA